MLCAIDIFAKSWPILTFPVNRQIHPQISNPSLVILPWVCVFGIGISKARRSYAKLDILFFCLSLLPSKSTCIFDNRSSDVSTGLRCTKQRRWIGHLVNPISFLHFWPIMRCLDQPRALLCDSPLRPHHRLYMASRVQPMTEPQREITDSNQKSAHVSLEPSGSGGVPITEIGWIHPPMSCIVACLQTIFDLLLPVLRLGDLVSHFRFWQIVGPVLWLELIQGHEISWTRLPTSCRVSKDQTGRCKCFLVLIYLQNHGQF